MKNYLILLLFLNPIIKSSLLDSALVDFIFNAKCADKKAKWSGACYYHLYEKNSNREIIKNEHAIFDKCGKGKKCNLEEETCEKDSNSGKREYDKSCNYNKDCLSNLCKNNKCSLLGEGDVCIDSLDNYIACKAGFACVFVYDSNGITGKNKCVKLIKEGVEPKDNEACMPGLEKDKDGKCKKYGSIDVGAEVVGNDLLCKSGLSGSNKDGNKRVCITLESDPTCNNDGEITSEIKSNEEQIIYPKDSPSEHCVRITDSSGNDKYYFEGYTKLQHKLYEEFLKDYNELDLDKINLDDNYASPGSNTGIGALIGKLEWKTRKKYYLYKYANILKAAGIIDSEGEVVKDKKCEYDFLLKNLNSSFIKLNTIFIAMIALLF